MTIARRDQLRLDVTPYYHCITRCVRRAFLCGKDAETGKHFDHRKGWVEKHLLLLSQVFCIDVAGYAVMSNHYHVVLHINQPEACKLTDDEVRERWFSLYKGPEIMQRFSKDEELSDEEITLVHTITAIWREELTNLSRFMGHLNQTISLRANREDGCRGRFWESRFKLQAILDVHALLRTLCYVDLNPIRAGIANTPETSKHTSVSRRVTMRKSGLMRFRAIGSTHTAESALSDSIPMSFKEYLELLDYTGREIRRGKRGFIASQQPGILKRLGVDAENWGAGQKTHSRWFTRAIGNADAIKAYCEAFRQQWIWQTNG